MLRKLSVLYILICIGFVPVHGWGEFSNFEAKLTNPIRVSNDGEWLFALNSPDSRLSVFDISNPKVPLLFAEIKVGLGPVSVKQAPDGEVWVVNEVSDSVSIVSLLELRVVETLQVKDEPMDVVFAQGRAFVSLGAKNQIAVFDLSSHESVGVIDLEGFNPRNLAVSPDGSRVYVAFALSGNRTTLLPRNIAPAQEAPTGVAVPPPSVGRIINIDDPIYSASIKYTMPDNDVAEIDASTLAVVRYFSGVGTINLGLAVNPLSGDLFVSNTDARNLVRFEPELRGYQQFNQLSRITISDGSVTKFDLNPGVDYNVLPNPSAKSLALAQPYGVVFLPEGGEMFIASFATDRVARVSASGVILNRIEIDDTVGASPDTRSMRGPRGLALDAEAKVLYVHNRISNTITVVDVLTNEVLSEIPTGSFDPTPDFIREGRGFLYDAMLSGNGTISCASCHVDGEMDMLAWDLGDRGGSMQMIEVLDVDGMPKDEEIHPMKGPMTTQTLKGLLGQDPLHWRGDRESFHTFNSAFDKLMGGQVLTSSDIELFKQFVESMRLSPNPNRKLDNGLSSNLNGGNAIQGEANFKTFSFLNGKFLCSLCHATGSGAATGLQSVMGAEVINDSQPMKIVQLRNLYRKNFFNTEVGSENLVGFGFNHDGAKGILGETHTGPVFSEILNNEEVKRDLRAFLLSFDTGTPPAVGYSVSLDFENMASPQLLDSWSVLEQQSATEAIDLVLFGKWKGFQIGFLYLPKEDMYQASSTNIPLRSRSQILAEMGKLDGLTLMGVPAGSGIQHVHDRTGNAIADGDEKLPQLYIAYENGKLLLSWEEVGFSEVLEFNADLGLESWKAQPGLKQSQGDIIQLEVEIESGNRFLRLRKL